MKTTNARFVLVKHVEQHFHSTSNSSSRIDMWLHWEIFPTILSNTMSLEKQQILILWYLVGADLDY